MTELVWEGKYKDGKKVTPVRIALPFQTIESINERAADREKRLGSLFSQKEETEWRNRLIWGDKKYLLWRERHGYDHDVATRQYSTVADATGIVRSQHPWVKTHGYNHGVATRQKPG